MKQKFLNLVQNPIVATLALGSLINTVARAAQTGTGSNVPQAPALVTTFSGLGSGLFCPIIGVMFWVLLLVSVVMVLWAAYLYVTSEGDAEKPSQARKMVLYAAVGITIALLARGVPSIVANIFGQTGSVPGVC